MKYLKVLGVVIAAVALVIAAAGLLNKLFNTLYGSNLCQQSSPQKWTKPIRTYFCEATATPTGYPTAGPPMIECNLPGSDWISDCISSQLWISYSEPGPSRQETECWDLGVWGIAASDGSLLINENITGTSETSYFRRGIYTPLPSNSTITFKLTIDDLQTNFTDMIANLSLGVVPSNPFFPNEGTLLIYQVESSGSPVHMKTRERGGEKDYLSPRYTLDQIHEIVVETDPVSVRIFVDGDLLIGSSPVPQNPVFWIGYLLPVEGRIIAKISDFQIEER